MQRSLRFLLAGALMVSAVVLLPVVTANAGSTNLLANPSAETAGTGGQPASWTYSRWGTSTATATWQTSGQDGTRSLAITMSAYSTGDAKWASSPVTVKPNTKYTLSDWYKATVATSLEATYTDATGKETYVWLTDVATSSAWKQQTVTFTTPADAVKVSVYHLLERKGTLQTDNYFLAETDTGTVPPPAPTVSLTAPGDGATVVGSQQLAATVSTDVVGVQFQVDGLDQGAEVAPPEATAVWDSTKTADGVHKVTAVARTATGATASASVTVTVHNAQTVPPPPPPPGGNLIGNPSVETASGSAPTGWASDKWGTNTAAFSYLSTGHTGSRSVKVDVTKYTNGDAEWRPAAVAVTAGQTYKYSAWYQSNVDTELDAEVAMADGSLQYAYLTAVPAAASWAQVATTYTVPAGATKLTVFQPVAKQGWVISDDFSLAQYTPAQFSHAIVSLTFDDGWLSGYTNGRPLLDKYHMAGTFYLISGAFGTDGYMTTAQAKTLQSDGQELASHTVTHPHLTTLSATKVDAELKNSQTSLRQTFGPTVAANFATPYGEYNATVIADCKKYYRSHRSTDEGYNTKDFTDVYNIKVQNILGTTTPAQVAGWVDQAVRDKSWLVIVYHEVDTTPEDSDYSVTPANLDAELAAINSKAIEVRTVGQALDEVQPQL